MTNRFSNECFYSNTAEDFLQDAENPDNVVDSLLNGYKEWLDRRAMNYEESNSRNAAWRSSIGALSRILEAGSITRNQLVALEYCHYSEHGNDDSRMDAIICGISRERENNAVVLEFKEWRDCKLRSSPRDGYVQLFRGGEWEDEEHPSYQALRYQTQLEEIRKISGIDPRSVTFSSFACLHNCDKPTRAYRSVLFGQRFRKLIRTVPLRTADRMDELGPMILNKVEKGNGRKVMENICDIRRTAGKKYLDFLRFGTSGRQN